jgi:hypothetical protein
VDIPEQSDAIKSPLNYKRVLGDLIDSYQHELMIFLDGRSDRPQKRFERIADFTPHGINRFISLFGVE